MVAPPEADEGRARDGTSHSVGRRKAGEGSASGRGEGGGRLRGRRGQGTTPEPIAQHSIAQRWIGSAAAVRQEAPGLRYAARARGEAPSPPRRRSAVVDGDGLQFVRYIVAGVQRIFELVVQALPPDDIHWVGGAGE
jgi:hypothetical protein